MRVAIIGGGAAGFFAAINIKEQNPKVDVTILEGSDRPLAKVRLSGGGRCNLTNTFEGTSSLSKLYPRGERLIARLFKRFDHSDTISWFEERGVRLVAQEDGCVFPRSQRSDEIIETFARLCYELGVKIVMRSRVEAIRRINGGFELNTASQTLNFDRVIVTTGGSPNPNGYSMFDSLSVEIIEPKPSLFSLKIANSPLTDLMGAVAERAFASVVGTKFRGEGALLITHWGVSGPATLCLSSYAARHLADVDYACQISINWVGVSNEDKIKEQLQHIAREDSRKQIGSIRPYGLPTRLWHHILQRGAINASTRWGEVPQKTLNTIVRTLSGDIYTCVGRSQHKEEFVTSGGVALSSINPKTLEAKGCEGLYFAGEVLDIDAVTGGYNLQAAWTTAYTVAQSIASEEE